MGGSEIRRRFPLLNVLPLVRFTQGVVIARSTKQNFCRQTGLNDIEERMSKLQTAAIALESSERAGPAELEKRYGEASRGPQHLAGPPKKRTGYYSNQKNSSMRVCSKRLQPLRGQRCAKTADGTKIIQKKCKYSLAPAKSCDRLASIATLSFEISGCAGRFHGNAEILTREDSNHGPDYPHRHLADHLRQHVFLRRQDVVAAYRRLRCRGRH